MKPVIRSLLAGLVAAGTFGVYVGLAVSDEQPKDGGKKPTERLFRYALIVKVKPASTEKQIADMDSAFRLLKPKIDEVVDVEGGKLRSPTQGYTHCYLIKFKNPEGLPKYVQHQAHRDLQAALLPLSDGILSFQYWSTAEAPAMGMDGMMMEKGSDKPSEKPAP